MMICAEPFLVVC